MSKALVDVEVERARQDAMWGVQDHHPAIWMMILGEEVGEANKAAIENRCGHPLSEYRKELIQVAAVAVAAVECLDRGEWI